MPTAPPTLTDAPASPDRADRATFSARAIALDDFTKNTQIPELRLALANVADNATEAVASATAASASASVALAASSATTWVSGQAYGLNATVISPADQTAYRKRTATSSSAVDPSLDPTNWRSLEEASLLSPTRLAQLHAIALSF